MPKTKNKTYHTITAIRIITTTMIIAITPQKRWFNVDRSTVTDYYGLNDDNLVAALEAGK